MKKLISSLLILICINTYAGSYYISPTGSNANAGTQAAPCKDLTVYHKGIYRWQHKQGSHQHPKSIVNQHPGLLGWNL